MRSLFILVACLSASTICHAGLIINGSFESPESNAEILSFGGGSTLPGWFVSGDVETVRDNFQGSTFLSYDGVRYLDLDGVHAGAISQSIATTPGAQYTLSFAYSNNPYPLAFHPPSARVSITGSGTLLSQTISHNTSTTSNPDWIVTSFAFTANSASTTISFSSLDPASAIGGIYLDAINVVDTAPEPGTTALIAGGLVLLACNRRRFIRG